MPFRCGSAHVDTQPEILPWAHPMRRRQQLEPCQIPRSKLWSAVPYHRILRVQALARRITAGSSYVRPETQPACWVGPEPSPRGNRTPFAHRKGRKGVLVALVVRRDMLVHAVGQYLGHRVTSSHHSLLATALKEEVSYQPPLDLGWTWTKRSPCSHGCIILVHGWCHAQLLHRPITQAPSDGISGKDARLPDSSQQA